MSHLYSILDTIVAVPILFGILVIVHEWGHFIAARLCGIRVDEFSVGFGPLALKLGQRGDTQYNIRWIPLGGFVKIAGMEPDEEPLLRAAEKVRGIASSGSGDTAQAETQTPDEVENSGSSLSEMPLLAENTPNLDETPEQRLRDATEGFYAHPLWQRAIVIFAGPFMSFVLGYFTLMGIVATSGVPSEPLPVVGSINPGSEAQRIGLQINDRFTKINGVAVTSFDQLADVIHSSTKKPVILVVQRGSRTLTIKGVPQLTTTDGQTYGALGFIPAAAMEHIALNQVIPQTNEFLGRYFSLIGHIYSSHNISTIRQHAGGPIAIVALTHEAVQQGGPELPFLMAQLSLSLAFFNLLPIPVLDGGHLLMFFIEAVRRGRRLSLEQQQSFMLTGLAVIGVLFVLIMFNDITRLAHH